MCSHSRSTIARLWEISEVRPGRARRAAGRQVEDPSLHGHVERARRLVEHQQAAARRPGRGRSRPAASGRPRADAAAARACSARGRPRRAAPRSAAGDARARHRSCGCAAPRPARCRSACAGRASPSGSCSTIWTSRGRRSAPRAAAARRPRPSSRISPCATGTSGRRARPMVVLPEPDSPTRPERRTARPARANETPSTARTGPKRTCRSSTSSSALTRPPSRARAPRRSAPGCRGPRLVAAPAPPGRSRPACRRACTATRSQSSATTPRSWDMNRIAMPSLVAQVAQELDDLGLHGHVERARRLVGEQHLGAQRQRQRDGHPLGLAAGELVRVAVQQRPARGAPRAAPCAASARALRAASAVQPQRVARRCRPTRKTGLKRRHRALEDHRDPARRGSARSRALGERRRAPRRRAGCAR